MTKSHIPNHGICRAADKYKNNFVWYYILMYKDFVWFTMTSVTVSNSTMTADFAIQIPDPNDPNTIKMD